MKKILSLLTVIVCLICASVSCASSIHLPIPGETETTRSNIYIEYMAIADAYNDLAKYDKAIQYYQYAMKNRKLYWAAYYKLGRAYAFSGNWAEAKKIYRKLLKHDPENLSIKMSLAYITAMDGDLKNAEEIYRLLWKENPENADVLVNYINILITNSKIDLAAEMLTVMKDNFNDNKNIADFEKKIAAAGSEPEEAVSAGENAAPPPVDINPDSEN